MSGFTKVNIRPEVLEKARQMAERDYRSATNWIEMMILVEAKRQGLEEDGETSDFA